MPTIKDAKKLQAEILKIYKEIKRVCDKNNIKYFAIGGTMLGAARHQGFIPWDDDMDLGIPIDEYEKFKKACKKDLKEPYEFKELLWTGGKVHNKNTTFLETTCLMNPDSCYGIFVDILPIIGTPNDAEARWMFQLDMFHYHFEAMTLERYPEASKSNLKSIKEWRQKILYSYPLWDSEKAIEFASGVFFSRNVSGLKRPVELKFEDTTIFVSSDYKQCLKELFGDYMKLPPKDQRIPHNEYAIIDFNRPYTYYLQKLNKIDQEMLSFLKKKHTLEGKFFNDSSIFAFENKQLKHHQSQILNSHTQKTKKLSTLYTKAKNILK